MLSLHSNERLIPLANMFEIVIAVHSGRILEDYLTMSGVLSNSNHHSSVAALQRNTRIAAVCSSMIHAIAMLIACV